LVASLIIAWIYMPLPVESGLWLSTWSIFNLLNLTIKLSHFPEPALGNQQGQLYHIPLPNCERQRGAMAPLFFYSGLFFFLDLSNMLFNGLHFIPQIFQMLL
jgi:hypothetical protein